MAKKVTLLGFTLAAAMLLSYIEAIVPISNIPGIKLGLANIAVIFALWRFGIKESISISLVRVFLSSLLFGNTVALIYSLAGATLSLLVMIILKTINKFSIIGISVAGGVMHNVGQILVAIFILGSSAVLYYLPVLIIVGAVCGVFIGLGAGLIIKRFEKINMF